MSERLKITETAGIGCVCAVGTVMAIAPMTTTWAFESLAGLVVLAVVCVLSRAPIRGEK